MVHHFWAACVQRRLAARRFDGLEVGMGRRWSLRTRFVAAAALCLLPLIGVALFVINSTLQHSRDQLLDAEFAVSDVVAQGMAGVINDNEMLLTNLAQNPLVRGM